jgi:uncharacterized protein
MRNLLAGVVLAVGLVSPAFAVDAPPSDASLHALLETMHARSLLDSVTAQTRANMDAMLKANLANQTLDDGQRKIIDDSERKMQDLLVRELTWEKLEPVYLDVYRKTFSQKEVDDMTAFYRTPSGQSVINKMPQVMTQTMQFMGNEMKSLMPEIQEISQDTADQLRAYRASKQASGTSP